MTNKFDEWNNLKKKLDKKNKNIYFKEKEICWLSIWQNIWTEIYWKWEFFRRPVLILKKLSSNDFYWIPLTSRKKEWKYFYELEINWKINTLLLSEWKKFSKNRLWSKIWKIENEIFLKIKEEFKNIF